MKAPRAVLILATVILTGCDHHNNNVDTSAPATTDSAYTGLPPTYPRAKPANLPPQPANLAPAPIAPASPRLAAAPAVQPPPAVDVPPAPPAQPAPEPVATSLPVAAPTPDATAPIETTPSSPPVSTLPPRPMSESEAKQQVVVLETSLGTIVVELNDVAAPRTCGNFRKLVSSGFYNHTIFHRVIPHFIIQGGDPNSRGDDRRTYGLGDPGYTLPAEIQLKHVAGAVAMARSPDSTNPRRESNGSQFYICVADCPSLDDQYTVFGKVIRGMDTVEKIASAPRDKNDDPTDRIEMQANLETKQQALEANTR